MAERAALTRDAYEQQLVGAWALAALVARMPLDAMLAAIDRADTLGAIVDPTLYRAKHRAMAQDRRLLAALCQVQREAAALGLEAESP